MKFFFYNSFIMMSFLTITSCTDQQGEKKTLHAGTHLRSVPAEVHLEKEKAGNAGINMPIEVLDSIYGASNIKKSTFTAEGQTYEAYFVYRNNYSTPSLRVEPLCNEKCKIWRIKVMDPAFKTESGIGIGSTVRDIRNYHYIDWAGVSENTAALRVERLGMTFQLDSTSVPQSLISKIAIENLPDSARIKSILITEITK